MHSWKNKERERETYMGVNCHSLKVIVNICASQPMRGFIPTIWDLKSRLTLGI